MPRKTTVPRKVDRAVLHRLLLNAWMSDESLRGPRNEGFRNSYLQELYDGTISK